MNLDLVNGIFNNLKESKIVQNFIKELSKVLENQSNKNNVDLDGKDMNNTQLMPNEELEFDRKEFRFLQDYLKKELADLSKGEIYIVTNKYENDNENYRYKVTQYKDNLECKYIAFEKDLPENVQLRDVVRKINGKYIYDEQATRIY